MYGVVNFSSIILMADPDAEVIALSPKTLMATNRFVCEVCNKGFQREQNLQLHRRGHNLPWKLRQKSTKEVKRKVYLCPEPTCVHHDPARALGDLTGIKKHFSRKHGEKKYKCEKCSKKYAVQSDWKAHSKTCGTREYKCDCGTLFSRYSRNSNFYIILCYCIFELSMKLMQHRMEYYCFICCESQSIVLIISVGFLMCSFHWDSSNAVKGGGRKPFRESDEAASWVLRLRFFSEYW